MSQAGFITGGAAARPKLGWFDRAMRRAYQSWMGGIRIGHVTVSDGAQQLAAGDLQCDPALRSRVRVHHPDFYRNVVLRGSIGAAESYMDGGWTCDDLVALFRAIVLNRASFLAMESGWARPAAAGLKLFHRLRDNTRKGSRRNIRAHYDLGNEFFATFLDETMTYSAAFFERPDATLAEAQASKYERICRRLELSPSDHVIEIGTGWGGFAMHAAARFGCRVTTTTISREQHRLAAERIRAAGLDDRVTVLNDDYRALQGQYDKLVSVEMIEAVGWRWFDTFFRRCTELLRPAGMALIQAITLTDQHFEASRRAVDFTQAYIFPGSCIPSLTALCGSMTRASDLRIYEVEDITPHYAATLRLWRERFLAQRDAVCRLGFDERFIRMWEYYLAYCEAGFRERNISDVHLLLTKPGARPAASRPALPAGNPPA